MALPKITVGFATALIWMYTVHVKLIGDPALAVRDQYELVLRGSQVFTG